MIMFRAVEYRLQIGVWGLETEIDKICIQGQGCTAFGLGARFRILQLAIWD